MDENADPSLKDSKLAHWVMALLVIEMVFVLGATIAIAVFKPFG